MLGKDWVPRLSVAFFERLRDKMVLHPQMVCLLGSTIPKKPLIAKPFISIHKAVLGKDWVPACLWVFPFASLHPVIVRFLVTNNLPAAIWHSMACMPRCIGCTLPTVPDLRTSDHSHQQFFRTDLSY